MTPVQIRMARAAPKVTVGQLASRAVPLGQFEPANDE